MPAIRWPWLAMCSPPSVVPQQAIAAGDRSWAELLLNLQKLRPEARFGPASPLLMPLRRIKDEDEIAIMRRAGEITEAAYAGTLDRLHHGMTNLDLITEVNYQLKKKALSPTHLSPPSTTWA